MELLLAGVIAVIAAAGLRLLLSARSFQVILGLSLLSFTINLLILASSASHHGRAPLLVPGEVGSLTHFVDPLPQALVLTAIVIGFATSALALVVVLVLRGLTRTDHVDGREPSR